MNAHSGQDPFLGLLAKIIFLTVISAAPAKPHDVFIGNDIRMVEQVGDDRSGQLPFEHDHQLIWCAAQSSTEIIKEIGPRVEVLTKTCDRRTLRK